MVFHNFKILFAHIDISIVLIFAYHNNLRFFEGCISIDIATIYDGFIIRWLGHATTNKKLMELMFFCLNYIIQYVGQYRKVDPWVNQGRIILLIKNWSKIEFLELFPIIWIKQRSTETVEFCTNSLSLVLVVSSIYDILCSFTKINLFKNDNTKCRLVYVGMGFLIPLLEHQTNFQYYRYILLIQHCWV